MKYWITFHFVTCFAKPRLHPQSKSLRKWSNSFIASVYSDKKMDYIKHYKNGVSLATKPVFKHYQWRKTLGILAMIGERLFLWQQVPFNGKRCPWTLSLENVRPCTFAHRSRIWFKYLCCLILFDRKERNAR